MRFYTIVMTGLVLVGSAALAAANPSMLPKHPGYPSGGEYANDPGQKNLTVEQSLRPPPRQRMRIRARSWSIPIMPGC